MATTTGTFSYRKPEYRAYMESQQGLMFVVDEDNGPFAKQQAAFAEFVTRFEDGGDLASLTAEEKAERQKGFYEEYMDSLSPDEREALMEAYKSFSGDEWAQPEACEIVDARSLEADLHTHGFMLLPHASAVEDFRDEEAVKSVYYPELVELVSSLTGATHVFLENHIIREEHQENGGGPVQVGKTNSLLLWVSQAVFLCEMRSFMCQDRLGANTRKLDKKQQCFPVLSCSLSTTISLRATRRS